MPVEATDGTEELAGRVAVVTGAGQGLGRAYAFALARAGASIVVNDRDIDAAAAVVAALRDLGADAAADGNAVGAPDAAEALVASALDGFGRLDVMVTNAGADRRGPALDLGAADWAATFDTHLNGTLHCALAAARAMRDQGDGGSIVTVTSAAFHAGTATMAPYCVAKGGVYALTRALAQEVAPFRIAVNAVSPPLTATAPALAFVDTMAAAGTPPDQVAWMRTTIADPDDVAPIVVLLARAWERGLSGEVFTLTRDEVSRLARPAPVVASRAETGVPWSTAELAEAVASLAPS